jgi:hypothetical protein
VLAIEAVARAPCWVVAESDQDARSARLLMAGDRLTVTAARSVMPKVGDASALALTINGLAARPLGRSGKAMSVRITSDSLDTYLPRRLVVRHAVFSASRVSGHGRTQCPPRHPVGRLFVPSRRASARARA